MAQIDLKFATINIKDGYSKAGAVNRASGVLAAATTITVDGFVGAAVAAGDTFTIGSESGTPTHTVTSATLTAGNTTTLVFTTAIASGGVADNAAIGVTKTGAVNHSGGYTAGTTTMVVSGITGVIQTGTTFTIAAETGAPTHTVTSHSETAGNTTSITFSTVLATGGTTDTAVITFLNANGAVNAPGGYLTGATTTVVDGFTGALAVGDLVTFPDEAGTPVHTISAHSETSLNTTSITFTPALAGAIPDDGVASIGPHVLNITIGDGTLEYTEHRNMEYKLNQGLLKYVRLGDQAPMDVSFDLVWEFLTAQSGDIVPTIEDALKKRGLASNWVSTDTDQCQPYAVDLEIIYVPPCPGEDTETIVMELFRWEELQHNAKDAKISVKGKCATFEAVNTRTAQS